MKRSNAEKLLKNYYKENLYVPTKHKKIKTIERVLKVSLILNLLFLLIVPNFNEKDGIDISLIGKLYGKEINNLRNNFDFKFRGVQNEN